MANERIPNDPYHPGIGEDEFGRPQRFDEDPRYAPEASLNFSKIALFVVAVALVLGALFYGLNNTHEASSTPPARSAQTQTSPQAPPGMRDVTPRANTQPGMTTGAAPAQPTAPDRK